MYWLVHITGPGDWNEEVVILGEDHLDDMDVPESRTHEQIKQGMERDYAITGQTVANVVTVKDWAGDLFRFPISYTLTK